MIRSALITVLIPVTLFATGVRFRAERRYPAPRGVNENYWAGDAWAFFHRAAFNAGKFGGVLLQEKDPGEKWGDLTAFGLHWRENRTLQSASVGFLRLRMALGLTADHGGSWSGSDPLSLVKPPVHRSLIEPATSPGDCDAFPLTGAGAGFQMGGLSLHVLQAVSRVDRSGTGLHRSAIEIARKGAVNEAFSFARLSAGPVGVSGAFLRRTDDSTVSTGRVGFDLNIENNLRRLSGEASFGIGSPGSLPVAFLVGMYGDAGAFRHTLTASRYPASFPSRRSSSPFGVNHNLAGGYGIRWKPRRGVTVTSGIEVLQRDRGSTFRAGVQGEETPFPRTTLLQRFTVSSSPGETTHRGVLGATWSPDRNTTLTLRLPTALHRSDDSTSIGVGAEVRLRHSFDFGLDATVSASAAETDDYNSRVYIYSLSFPGEMGSSPLYGSVVAAQAMVTVQFGEGWRLRGRISRFHWYGRDSIGSGFEQTSGPSRTDLGLQLDWNP